MTFAEAENLVLREGHGEDGLAVCVRMLEDPGAERMRRLLVALRVIFDGVHGQPAIDRRLAGALYYFSACVFQPVTSQVRSHTWRDEFIATEVVQLEAAVESIFSGVWVGA